MWSPSSLQHNSSAAAWTRNTLRKLSLPFPGCLWWIIQLLSSDEKLSSFFCQISCLFSRFVEKYFSKKSLYFTEYWVSKTVLLLHSYICLSNTIHLHYHFKTISWTLKQVSFHNHEQFSLKRLVLWVLQKALKIVSINITILPFQNVPLHPWLKFLPNEITTVHYFLYSMEAISQPMDNSVTSPSCLDVANAAASACK